MGTIYRFGTDMIDDNDVKIDKHSLTIAGLNEAVDLELNNPFDDMV